MKKGLIAASLCLALWLAQTPATAQPVAQDKSAAVIFAYHRIGEDQYPENNIRREQFAAHVQELASGDYNVMALPDIVKALQENRELPDRTIALTFDGGHRSVLTNAVPLLEKYNLPYTLFIPVDNIDRVTDDYMDWDDLKYLKRSRLASIGIHPASYVRLHDEPESEITRQINNARARYRDQLGENPVLFAYPFGEYSEAYRHIIEQQGFIAAFGQQSGVAYAAADMMTLPRFPMTESYGGLDRFRLAATALPLPASDVEPKNPLLATTEPAIGFTIDKALAPNIADISCFISGQEKPEMEVIGENRIELRLARPLEAERARINCTLPLPTGENYEDPRWRWFGMQLLVPRETQQTLQQKANEAMNPAQDG